MADESFLQQYRKSAPMPASSGVDESFLDQYRAKEAPPITKPAATEWWQGYQDNNTVARTLQRTGIGAVRGAKDVIDTGSEVLANTFGSKETAEKIKAENKAGREAWAAEYPAAEGLPNATDVGRFGGQVAPTLAVPLGGLSKVVGVAPKVLATGEKLIPWGTKIADTAARGFSGGVLGSVSTSSTKEDYTADDAIKAGFEGAGGNILLGGSGKLAAKVLGKNSALRDLVSHIGGPSKASEVADILEQNPNLNPHGMFDAIKNKLAEKLPGHPTSVNDLTVPALTELAATVMAGPTYGKAALAAYGVKRTKDLVSDALARESLAKYTKYATLPDAETRSNLIQSLRDVAGTRGKITGGSRIDKYGEAAPYLAYHGVKELETSDRAKELGSTVKDYVYSPE